MTKLLSVRGKVLRANTNVGKKHINGLMLLDVTHSVHEGIEFLEVDKLKGTLTFNALKHACRHTYRDADKKIHFEILVHVRVCTRGCSAAGILNEGDEFKGQISVDDPVPVCTPFNDPNNDLFWIEWLK